MKKWIIPALTAVAAVAIIGVAFGQQGTSTPSSSGTSTSGTPSSGGNVQQFHADLKPLNNSGVTGTAAFSVANGQLGAQVQAKGLQAGQPHPQLLHQMASGQATCPTSLSGGSSSGTPSASGTGGSGGSASGPPSASGTSSSGVLTEIQAEASYGPPIFALTQEQFPVAAGNEQILYANTFNANVSGSSGSGTPSAGGTSSSSSGTPSTSGTSSSGGAATTPAAGASSPGVTTPSAGTSSPGTATTPPAGASSPGAVATPSATPAITLESDVVVLYGMTVQGVYDPAIPVACGQIQQGAASGALGTPIAGQTPTGGAGGAATTPSAGGTSSSGSTTPSSSGTPSSGSYTPPSSGTSSSGG